jgi:N-acetylated-alpha-linked acidic dipeptidase
VSGQAPLLEEARGLGLLLKQGWKPRRTIIYAAWDGEEPMLLGSTEWVEAHAAELRQHAAVYINSDGNDRGTLSMGGSHSLEKFINGVARDIEDPETKMTVWQRLQLSRIADAKSADDKKELRGRSDLRIAALGSGTDFTGFLDHLGIATLDLGYGGEDEQGIYHSIYDDFYWYTHYSDSTFVYGRALSQAAGTAVMRLANADILPFAFTNLAETSGRYLKELKKLRDSVADQITERNSEIGENVYFATSDPREPTVAPVRQSPAPQVNWDVLDKASDSLTKSAARYDAAYAKALDRMSGSNASRDAQVRTINQRLLQAERALTSEEGLPGRPWYRHMIYAPGFYTGYGVKTMPGPREAIEQHQWANIDHEIGKVAGALNREATLVSELARELDALR